jgi:type I restriction enzyme, S subunit
MTTSSAWPIVHFGEIAEFRNGLNFTKENFGKGIKVIGVSDFQDYSIPRYDELVEINPEGVVKNEDFLKEGDILFVRSNGNRNLIGRNLFLKGVSERIAHSGFTIRARLTSKNADPKFYAYLFRSSLIRETMSAQGSGTNINNLNQQILKEIRVPLPPLSTQQKITTLLSAYDDLIENNTRRIKILGEMAQAIYRKWFVKDSHCDNVSSVTLNDICILITDGKHGDCQAEENSGYYFISCKDVKEGLINYLGARQITEKDYLETHKRTQLQPDDIVITNSGTIGRMALVPDVEKVRRTTFQKSVAILKPNTEKIFPNWLFYYLLSNKDTLIGQAGGTAQKNLLLRDLRAFKVLIPPFSSMRQFNEVIQPIRYMIELLHEKNANLRRTRDLLLPKLISGEIDVSDLDIKIPDSL